MLARPFSQLVHAHAGRAGVAMGGGPSLPGTMDLVPRDAVKISANAHGAKFCPVDYIVTVDRHAPGIGNFAGSVPIIGPHAWADFRMAEQAHPNSGIMSAWALAMMGCAPVFLAGMDLYRDGTYYHDPAAHSTGTHLKLQTHLNRWATLASTCIENGSVPFRVFGGPLVGLFKLYDIDEVVRPVSLTLARKLATGIAIVFERHWKNEQREEDYAPGDRIEVDQRTAERFVRTQYARIA